MGCSIDHERVLVAIRLGIDWNQDLTAPEDICAFVRTGQSQARRLCR
jgi:hypothetical protein